MIEVYVHSRRGTESDHRTGTITDGPCSVKAVLPDGHVIAFTLTSLQLLVIEVTELQVDAAVAPAPSLDVPKPGTVVVSDPASGLPKIVRAI